MTLIDANVLIASFMPGHVHHERAMRELQTLREREEQVILHPLAVAAFFRLCTSKHLGIPAAKVMDCMKFIRSMHSNLHVVPFVEKPEQLDVFEALMKKQRRKQLNVNDSWLAACAVSHKADVLSFDGDFEKLTI